MLLCGIVFSGSVMGVFGRLKRWQILSLLVVLMHWAGYKTGTGHGTQKPGVFIYFFFYFVEYMMSSFFFFLHSSLFIALVRFRY